MYSRRMTNNADRRLWIIKLLASVPQFCILGLDLNFNATKCLSRGQDRGN